MKKGNSYTGIVERVDFPNKGIVKVETKQEDGAVITEYCVVKNTLPGQKVTFMVNKVRKGKAEGRLLNIEECSALETGSPCPHFGVCGGCTYISLPYEEQLKIKEAQIQKQEVEQRIDLTKKPKVKNPNPFIIFAILLFVFLALAVLCFII